VVHPTRGEIPLDLYDYQARFLADHSRARIILKARQIGLSLTIGINAAHTAIMRPRSKVLLLSKSKDDAIQLRSYVETTIRQDPAAPRIVANNTTLLRLSNGSEVRSLAAGKNSGRGFPATDVYLDEFAFALFAEKLYTAISPTVARGGSITVCSTPNGRNNLYFLLWEGELGVSFAQHRIPWWECPAYMEGWDGTWTQRDASDPLQPWDGQTGAQRGEPRSPWFLAERPKYTTAAWAQEFACDFADSGEAVFATTYVDGAADGAWGLQEPQPGRRYGMAIDPAGKGKDKTAIGVADITDDVFQLVAYRSWTKGPYELLYSTAEELAKAYGVETIAVDATGMGGPIVEQLQSRVESIADVQPFTFSSTSKVPLLNRLVLRLERGQLKFKDVPELRRQLLLYQWEDAGLMTDAVMMAALLDETARATGWMAQIRAARAAQRAEESATA